MSKKEKTLHEKVKQFFGRREPIPINQFEKLRVDPYSLNNEILLDIQKRSENNLSHRLKSIKELYEIVLTKKLEDFAVEAIIDNVQDLLSLHNSVETRHIILQFYTAIIHSQIEQMSIMRSFLFRLVVHHNIQDDFHPRLEMLKALTENGKNISCFEVEMGEFLLEWFPDVMSATRATEFFVLVTNVIKFNAAYLDDNVINGFVQNVLYCCIKTKSETDIQESLNILEAILCYSHLPHDILHVFICTLCYTVNIEKFSTCSWKQMRNLLGTNVGHTGIYMLCLILQDSKNYQQPSLVRGAVFFIGMALWGPSHVKALVYPATAVLPSFLKVLNSNDDNIAYEVILSLQRLVKEDSEQLKIRTMCWNMIFEIISKILEYPKLQKQTQSESLLARALHDFLDVAEDNCPDIVLEDLYNLIEQLSDVRSEKSVSRLISYITSEVNPLKPDFLININKLLEKFFKNEKRPVIQLEALNALQNIRSHSCYYFEDDLMDQTILQNLSHCEVTGDVKVRSMAIKILIQLAESCCSNWFFDIIDVMEKVMKRVLENQFNQIYILGDVQQESFSDVLTAVEGCISLFEKKFFTMPSNHCIEIFNVLVKHMQKQYEKLTYTDEIAKIRLLIVEFFLRLRANQNNQIGLLTNGITEYSVYILCDSRTDQESIDSVPTSPLPGSPSAVSQTLSYLNYGKIYQVMITCLKNEKDWRVLEMLLKGLPVLLKNKALFVRANCNISSLCLALYSMTNDGSHGFPGSLKNTPERLTRTDVHSQIFPCVAALTSYHSVVESHVQRILIRCLQSGLVSRSAKICMEGLTLCTLEMQNSMIKLLPDVLLKLSKISATVTVSVSVLEFLSNLIRLPHLYVSFVEDQYMSIFAIALPYTNPFKFNQYTVALAHHVLSMWFLKCRIPFRRDFAKFITKGLHNNLNIPREYYQTSKSSDASKNNEDTSASEMSNEAIIGLHTELMETGLDLMARFTFGMTSNVPKRSPVAEFLLENGQKSSWLVGNNIVTITTSGCGTKSFKDGLCELCYSSCNEANLTEKPDKSISDHTFQETDSVTDLGSEPFSEKRKRHRSAVIPRTATAISNIKKTKDDIHLRYQKNPSSKLQRRHTILTNTEPDRSSGTVEWNTENKMKEDRSGNLCSCWCTSWAEIHIRRPTGNTSWMMKIQNQLFLPSAPLDLPLSALASLVLPFKGAIDNTDTISFADSESSYTMELEPKEPPCAGAIDIVPHQKASPPVRRTNSSPDMNTAWSNFESLEQTSKSECDDNAKEFTNTGNASFQIHDISKSELLTEKPSTKKNLKLDLSTPVRSESLLTAPALKEDKSTKNSDNFFHKEGSAPLPSSAHGQFRDRGYTMPVMSPAEASTSVKQPETSRRSGMSPSFAFLQLFHNSNFGPATHKPILLLKNSHNERSLNVLDHIPPYDTHKIGVVYVGPGQSDDEVAILSNVYGSARYVAFLRGLGKMVLLNDIDPQTTYLGGLDTRGEDGKFTIVWHDDVMQVAFHIATLMLNKESDKMRNEKRKHIGNDSVVIVYNESGKDFNLSTIKGQVINACVIIKPDDFNSNIVTIKLKSKELTDTFGHTEEYIVSDACLSVFIRQMALHANLAALIISRRQQSGKYAQISNWLERLRTIKRLRSKVLEDLKNKNENSGIESTDAINFDDFTDYV